MIKPRLAKHDIQIKSGHNDRNRHNWVNGKLYAINCIGKQLHNGMFFIDRPATYPFPRQNAGTQNGIYRKEITELNLARNNASKKGGQNFDTPRYEIKCYKTGYRFKFISSESMVSIVVMIFELA